jgi:hypothetical protein
MPAKLLQGESETGTRVSRSKFIWAVASSFETALSRLLRMRSARTFMVRSAATPRVSNHEATIGDHNSTQPEMAYAFGGSAWLMTRFTVGNARRSARSIASTFS